MPRRKNGWRSPLQTILEWYRDNNIFFPGREKDLRADWGHLHAYGCRAYPLVSRYQAEKDKIHFKSNPRAHIGYLVGYVASSIYRIWVPALQRVISTQDVTFDESTFFNPHEEAQIQLLVREYQPVVELIALPQLDKGATALNKDEEDEIANGEGVGDSTSADSIGPEAPQVLDSNQQSNRKSDQALDHHNHLPTPESTPAPGEDDDEDALSTIIVRFGEPAVPGGVEEEAQQQADEGSSAHGTAKSAERPPAGSDNESTHIARSRAGSSSEPTHDPPEDQEERSTTMLTTQSIRSTTRGAPRGPRNEGIESSNVRRSARMKTKSQKVQENEKMEASI